MSGKNKKIKFEDYVNMVRKRAWYYSRIYKMDYDEVESQGFLIYCMSLKTYESKKASFSTFLYRNLSGRLRDYCQQIKDKTWQDMHLCDSYIPEIKNNVNINEEIDFDIFKARETITEEEFILYAKCILTSRAYYVLRFLLKDQLIEFHSKSKPSLVKISKKLNIELDELVLIWKELKDFWNYKGAAFYASI